MSKKRQLSSSEDDEPEEQTESNEKIVSISETKKKKITPGVIYLSRIPNKMNVTIIRSYFDQYAPTGRIYLQLSSKFFFFIPSFFVFLFKKMTININENVVRNIPKVG